VKTFLVEFRARQVLDVERAPAVQTVATDILNYYIMSSEQAVFD
jgi:hypothetical protein